MRETPSAPRPSLGIFILCHNRPDQARQAIQSVLRQGDNAYTLTISDNSSDDRVKRMVLEEFPDLRYIKRTPELPALEHFNRCIDEVSTDYFCLFHDDDIMEPDFVQEIKKACRHHPQAVAIGCNAWIEEMGARQHQPSFLSRHAYETIGSARNLAARYFSRSQSGIAPFPSYVYRSDLVKRQRLHNAGGKYTDVTWLLELAHRAPLVWIRHPLMTYRIHHGNDSNIESRRDRLSFLAYLKRNSAWIGAEILEDYRCSFIYKNILKNKNNPHTSKRTDLARRYVAQYRWVRYARFSTYTALIQRALVKQAHKP